MSAPAGEQAPTVLDRLRVLVIAGEQPGMRMAGPAIRSLNLAKQLARRGACVTLAAPAAVDPALLELDAGSRAAGSLTSIGFGTPGARGMHRLAERHDVVVTQPQRVDVAWALHHAERPVIYDLYVPSFVERIAQLADESFDRSLKERLLERDRLEYAAALELGNAFVCASERQRDHWLGALGHAGRLDLGLLERDPRGERLVGVVPFGIEQPPAAPSEPGPIRGALVPADSIVLLWTGGMWNWFDPVTVLEALARARASEPRLRLVVMGMRHPESRWHEQSAAQLMQQRADELGLLDAEDPAVVLSEAWAPYAERARWYADTDVAVSAHFDTLETRLSFRTRFVDHLWAGVPTITTAGGDLAAEMASAGAARVVDERDVEGWTTALVELAGDDDRRVTMGAAARGLGQRYHWDQVTEPLASIVARLASDARGPRARPRAIDAARYGGLLLRVRVQTKGARSLVDAVRGAFGR